MTGPLKSLRKGVWSSDQSELGEAVRDLHGFCSQLRLTGVVSARNVVWSEPFSFKVDAVPELVILGDARSAGESIAAGAIAWQYAYTDRTHRVSITRAEGLTAGKAYDLKFLVVY